MAGTGWQAQGGRHRVVDIRHSARKANEEHCARRACTCARARARSSCCMSLPSRRTRLRGARFTAVMVDDKVSRSIAALNVRRIGVIDGQKPLVVLSNQLARRLVCPLHQLPARVEIKQTLLPSPVEESLRKPTITPALVDDLRYARARILTASVALW